MKEEPQRRNSPTRGVYFLSNDTMYEFTIAFLNSFRTYNPSVSLCFIPYNDNVDNILALKEAYHFEVYQDNELLKECDAMSLQLHDEIKPAYRKLVIWKGIYDQFIYIDIDTVVLADLSFAFEFLADHDCLTATSNIRAIRKFVWLDGIEETGLLTADQIAYAANTGFVVSKKIFTDFGNIKDKLEESRLLKNYMELNCMEQPFLNYLIVTSGKPYTSLCELGYSERQRRVLYEYWGGEEEAEIINGKMYRKTGGQICFIHWSGVWRLKDKMPNKKIWDHYRYMNDPQTGVGNLTIYSNPIEIPADIL
ncbi:MAG: hypothetical protein ABIR18_10810 [Chitinophagaceae bacterium]